ncbi:hypothetical protein KSS87_008122 [Heliosperma pusillum]|nr:hypothetical protein KSS87_008122 [Heliosperma pusillum]
MFKICVGALSEPINCLCDLLPFLTWATKYRKPCIIGCNLGRSGGRTGLRFCFS